MAKIRVTKPFILTLDDHSKIAFEVGECEIDDALVDHWYVKLHTNKDPVAKPPIVEGDIRAALARLDQLRSELDAREQALNAREADISAREAALSKSEGKTE